MTIVDSTCGHCEIGELFVWQDSVYEFVSWGQDTCIVREVIRSGRLVKNPSEIELNSHCSITPITLALKARD